MSKMITNIASLLIIFGLTKVCLSIQCELAYGLRNEKLTANCSFQNSENQTVKIPGYDLPNEVQILIFRGNGLKSLTRDSFRNLQQLEKIDVSENYISRIEPETFAGLPNLKFVDLSSNNIDHISPEMFDRLLSPIVDVNLNQNSLICNAKNNEAIEKLENMKVFIRHGFCLEFWSTADYISESSVEANLINKKKTSTLLSKELSPQKIRVFEFCIISLSVMIFIALFSLFLYLAIYIVRFIYNLKQTRTNRNFAHIDQSGVVVPIRLSDYETSSDLSEVTTSENSSPIREREFNHSLFDCNHNLIDPMIRDLTFLAGIDEEIENGMGMF